jgi:tyrosine-protein phosphatase YwqE
MIKSIKNLFGSKVALPEITTDIHSHLIPGIDDGSKTMEESIEMIEAFIDLGYTRLITTPHIMSHRFPNTKEILEQGLHELRAELAARKMEITVEVASEYYLDETVMELVEKGEVLTFGKERYMLFEMSYVQPLHHLEDMIFEIKVAGYTPVLAHPERYVYMHDDFEKYRALKAKGVLFQLNVPSLGGYYSKPVQKTAKRLVEAGMIDLIGSDAHKMAHLSALKKVRSEKSYAAIFKNNTILNNTL